MSNLSQFFGGGAPQYWVSGTTYAIADVVRSPTDHQRYVRIVAGSGTTDPASDTTNWRPDGGRAIKSIQRGVITLSGTGNSATATISAVNTAKTELRFLGVTSLSGGAIINEGMVHIALTNSTTITSTRLFSGNSNTAAASWELTEYY